MLNILLLLVLYTAPYLICVLILLTALLMADFSFFSRWPLSQTTRSGPGSSRQLLKVSLHFFMNLLFISLTRFLNISYSMMKTPPSPNHWLILSALPQLSFSAAISNTSSVRSPVSHLSYSFYQLFMVLTG
jgi:hypothetical protein